MISKPLPETDVKFAQRDFVCNERSATEVKPKQEGSTKLFAHHGGNLLWRCLYNRAN